jgi:anti-anti-sigma factor
MGEERLIVDFARRDDGSVDLRVSGKLKQATAPLLEGVLQALRNEVTPVVIDLSGVEHIDAHGLDLLLTAETEADGHGAPVEVVGVPESLRERRPPFPQDQ